jgi:hypothetical protein
MAQNNRRAQLKPRTSSEKLESSYAQRLSWLEEHGNSELRKLWSAQPPRWGNNNTRSRPSLVLCKFVYRVLVSRAHSCGTVQETQQQIAHALDESAVQTRSALRYLQHLGLLECVQRANSGGRKSGGSARPAVYAVTALQKYLAEQSEQLEQTAPLDTLEELRELSTAPKESGYSCEYSHSLQTGSEKKNEGTPERNEGTPGSTSPRVTPRFNSSAAIFAEHSSAPELDEKNEQKNEQNSDSDTLQTGSEPLRATQQRSSSDQAPDSTQELTGAHSASQQQQSRAVFDECWNALEERTLERIMREQRAAGKTIGDPKQYKKTLRKNHAQQLRAARSTGWDRFRYVPVVRTELEDWLTAKFKEQQISPALWQRLEQLENEHRAELIPPQPAAPQLTDEAWNETRDLALRLLGIYPEDTQQRIKILMARGAELEEARALISARWIHIDTAHPSLVEFVRRTAAVEEIPAAFLERLDRLEAEQLCSVPA